MTVDPGHPLPRQPPLPRGPSVTRETFCPPPSILSVRSRRRSLQAVLTQSEDVAGDELLCPEKATVFSLCKVIGQEYPFCFAGQISRLRARAVDHGTIDERGVDTFWFP